MLQWYQGLLCMNHPLINNLDDLSIEELQTKISDLSKKLSWSARSGNAQLRMQIQMALDSYMEKYREKQQAIYNAALKNGPDHTDKIDIS
jgi:hypothetical protein